MSHIPLARHPDLVARLESVISHPDQLAAFNRHARKVLNTTGHLPGTPAWNYLHWRRSLDPPRFDRNHPFWTKLFRREERVSHLPSFSSHPGERLGQIPSALPSLPASLPVEIPTVGVDPQVRPTIGPSGAVPEPPTGLLVGIGLALVALWRMWSRAA